MNDQEKKAVIDALRPFAFCATGFESSDAGRVVLAIHPPLNDIDLPLDKIFVADLRRARDLFLVLVGE